MGALEDGVAECQRQGLTMSACLALLSQQRVCGANPVGAHFPDAKTVQFYCGAIPTAEEAAAELRLSIANSQASAAAATGDVPSWLLLAGAAALLGVGAWWLIER